MTTQESEVQEQEKVGSRSRGRSRQPPGPRPISRRVQTYRLRASQACGLIFVGWNLLGALLHFWIVLSSRQQVPTMLFRRMGDGTWGGNG